MVISKLYAPRRPSGGLFKLTEIAIARMGPIMGDISMLATMVAALSMASPTAAMIAATALQDMGVIYQ